MQHAELAPTPTMPSRAQRGRHVLVETARVGGVTVEELLGPSRKPRIVWLRRIAIHLLYVEYRWDQSRIARLLCRDPSTISDACRKAWELRHNDEEWARLAMNVWLATRD